MTRLRRCGRIKYFLRKKVFADFGYPFASRVDLGTARQRLPKPHAARHLV